MRIYNTSDWLKFIFQAHKGDTVRKLFSMLIFISAYTACITYLEINHWQLGKEHYLKQIVLMHNLLGFALSILIVFRTNTAYDRWWEGRKQWGALTNTSRNLAIKIFALTANSDTEIRNFYRQIIPMYAQALSKHLKSETVKFQLDENDHPELKTIDAQKHVPNQIARLMVNYAFKLQHNGKITGEQLIILNTDLQDFANICGACERIKNTPIPFSYSAFIKKFIFFYIMSLPFGYSLSMGYYAVPVVSFIFYVIASLELIAEEIEDPFGNDSNDLPMDKIASNIKMHVEEII
jgi:putative membrane protein